MTVFFIVCDARNYVLCNALCVLYPDKLAGVSYDESVISNYYANYDLYVYINVKSTNTRKSIHFVDDWSMVDEFPENCFVLSRTDLYSKYTQLCSRIGLDVIEPKCRIGVGSLQHVREDETAVIELLEHYDYKYDIHNETEPVDIPALLYKMSYYTAGS